MVAPERHTQAPQDQNNPEKNTEASPVVDYNSARVPAGIEETGDTTPMHDDWEPRRLEKPIDTEKRKASAKLIALGATAITVITGAAAYFNIRSSADEHIERVAGADRTASAPATPGIDNERGGEISLDNATVEEFYNDAYFTDEERIAWADKIIRERTTPELIDEMNNLLIQGNRQTIEMPVEPSIDNTGDEILLQNTVAGYIASTAPTPDEGRKLIAGFADPSNPGFETSLGQIGGGQKPVIATHFVSVNGENDRYETPVFHETVVGNYSPRGIPSKRMSVTNTFNGKRSQLTVAFKENRWITVDTITRDNPNWISKPHEIPVQ